MPNSREAFPVKSPVTGTGPTGASSTSFARSLSFAPGDPASAFHRAWSITKKHFRQTGASSSNVAPQLGHLVGTPGGYPRLRRARRLSSLHHSRGREDKVAAPERRYGGLTLGGILVLVGIVVVIVWSFWIGLIIALIGLVAFGGFVRGKWY